MDFRVFNIKFMRRIIFVSDNKRHKELAQEKRFYFIKYYRGGHNKIAINNVVKTYIFI